MDNPSKTIFLCLLLAGLPGISPVLARNPPPNILLILSDDQGYGDLSLHGNEVVETPHLDALALASVRLDKFHAAPLCAPTRASLMTGKQFLKVGVWGVHGGRDYLSLGEVTLADRLRAAGYRTAMAGKWHLGKTEAYLPHSRGFDETWSITGRLYQHTDPVLDRNGRELRPVGWTVDILTDALIEWMTRADDRPFFAYLAHPYIHEPYYAPDEIVRKYRQKGLSESFARLCAMTEHLDRATGRLLDELERCGLHESTVVVFLGDNGPIGNPVNLPHLTEEEMQLRNPAGLRGVKGNLYENGTRAPAFIRWPGRFPARIVDQEIDITDIVPTLLSIAGIETGPDAFDGRSVLALLNGEVDHLDMPPRIYANHEAIWPGRSRLYDFLGDRNRMVFADQVLAIRSGDHKFVQGYGRVQLFNVKADPTESQDLALLEPTRADALQEQLRVWWEAIMTENPVAYGMPVFILPTEAGHSVYLHGCAPSAVFGEVVQASHDSQSWYQRGDGVEFAVRVPAAGRYRLAAELVAAGEGTGLVVTAGVETRTTRVGGDGRLDLGEWFFDRELSSITLRLADDTEAGPAVGIERVSGVSVIRLD